MTGQRGKSRGFNKIKNREIRQQLIKYTECGKSNYVAVRRALWCMRIRLESSMVPPPPIPKYKWQYWYKGPNQGRYTLVEQRPE